jgi:threonylcarbamoyladenosine tRNA methylthiotransferase MtaB
VFSYSPRPGTAAASWQQVNGKLKKERARLLRDLSLRKNTNFRRLFAGKECEAIVIKKKEAGAEVLISNYFKVFVPSCPHDEGKEVRVKITKVDTGKTTGQIVNLPSS